MTANGVGQILIFFAIIVAIAVPLGTYMARVFTGERTFLSPVLAPVERVTYSLCGVDE
jgi:K+-transporting ATPase ATPase A chain